MGKITNISVQQNDNERCNIYIDGEFATGLSMELVLAYNLKVGDTLGKERLMAFAEDDEKKTALKKAIGYISRTLKTKRQIKDYLIKKGYSEQTVWHCIDKLKEYNYVDDVEYARRYIESRYKLEGKKLMEYKLMAKGIKKEDIALAYENSNLSFGDSAKTIAQKYMKNKENTKENRTKAYKYLLGKGFSYEQASVAIGSMGEDD